MKSILYKGVGIALVVVAAMGTSYLLAWTGPTATPPGNNVAAPVNVSSTGQTKSGDLTVNGGLTGGTFLSTGAAQFNAGVGIGVAPTTSAAHLNVNGWIRGNFLCIAGDCKSAWPSGGGSGDITDVLAGTGLSGGGTSGSVTLTADTSYLQRRIGTGCTNANESIKTVNADGSVTCEVDDLGSGGGVGSGTSGRLAYYSAATTIGSANYLRVDTTNSRLGVNLSAGPSYTLDVNGTANASQYCISGASCISSWPSGGGSGDITDVLAGTGLSGGGTSGSVTLNLANTAVSPGSYTSANITVDAQGRITAASNGSGGVGGSGSAGYVPRFSGATTLGNSSIQDNGSANVSINTAPDTNYKLKVNGNVYMAYDASRYIYMNSGGLVAAWGFLTPTFSDLDDQTFYVNPAGQSNINTIYASTIYDRDNSALYLDPNGQSNINTMYVTAMWDRESSSYYADFNGSTKLNNLQVTGTYTGPSDRRLKKNIEILSTDESLRNILGLTPVSFQWKDDGREDIGFVAQEVEKIYPRLVHTDAATGLKSLEYVKLIVPAIAALQAQQKLIDAQTTRIADLEKRLEEIEKGR